MFVNKVPDLITKKAKAIELVKAELSLDSKFAEAYKEGKSFGLNGEGRKVNADDFEKGVAAQAENIQREMSDNDLASYWNNIIRPKKLTLTQEAIDANPDKYKNKKVGDEIKLDNLWDYDVELTTEQRKTFGEAFTKDILGELGAVRAANRIIQTKTVKKGSNKSIIIDFKKGILNASKFITTNISKDITYTLDQDVFRGDGTTPNPDAMYVLPKLVRADGQTIREGRKVKYWKKVPKDPNDPTKGYKVSDFIINEQGMLDAFGSKPREL